MRGKQVLGVEKDCNVRITPAYAGKTHLPIHRHWMPRDHPRVCGENQGQLQHPLPEGGSPPRMRGKLAPAVAGVKCDGITPAYAGKTNRDNSFFGLHKDHPRVCGEN